MPSRLLWSLVLALSLMLCVVLAAPPKRPTRQGHLPPLLPRLEVVRAVGAPIHHLVTDYFWIQTIQAVGKASNRHEYRDIYDYANLVTELDPKFRQVYVFAGVSIPFPARGGKWLNTEESTRLLEKGLRNFPDLIHLRIILAYNLSTFHQQYERAAKLLEETSRLPGAPEYLPALATRLHAQAGNFDAGLELARSLAESSTDPETRELFERRVLELELERELKQVDAAVEAYRQREGRLPSGLQALVDAGDLPRVPEDPLGGLIQLDEEGRGISTAQEKRLTDFARTSMEESP
ncbi:tetratricopeptide repeat protein [Pyxidicoccus sp. 3LFB2]